MAAMKKSSKRFRWRGLMSGIDTCVVIAEGEAAMARLAAQFASWLQAPCCLALSGDLGAGKTTFARGLIQALCHTPVEVLSPTFLLHQDYTGHRGELIHHLDLYRIASPAELIQLGVEDMLREGICLIEWPQVAQQLLPDDTLSIHIRHREQGQGRELALATTSPRWQTLLEHFNQMRPV
jgi:tRNA threonylcarbamoyl adenosine modification protein YjeE